MTTIIVNGYQVTVDDTFLKLSPAEQNETVAEIAKTIAAREAQFSDLMKGTTLRLRGVDPTAIAKAREAGYSDDEIIAHLSAKAPEQFKQGEAGGLHLQGNPSLLIGGNSTGLRHQRGALSDSGCTGNHRR